MQTDNEHSCATIYIIETFSGPKMYLDSPLKSLNVIALQKKISKQVVFMKKGSTSTLF